MTISMLKNFYRWAWLVALPYSLTVVTPLLAVEDTAPVTNHHQSSAVPKNLSCATGHTPAFSEPRERFLGQLAELAQREDYFYYVGWSAGGEHALTHYSDEQRHDVLSIINTATAQETTKIVYESEDEYTTWSWHPTQQLLATIHSIPLSDTEKVGVLSIIDVKGEAQSITFPLSPFKEDMGVAFFQVDWSPNGQYLAVSTEQAESIGFSFGDVESFIHMFTYQNDSLVRTASLEFPFPLKPDIEWSADSRYFVALGGRGRRTSFNPIIFDVLNNTEVVAPEAMNRGVRKVDIHPNSRYLLERYGYGAGILDLETGEIISNFPKENAVADVGWSADGQKIAMLIHNEQTRAVSASHDELIVLSGTDLTSEPIHRRFTISRGISWSPNRQYLFVRDEQDMMILIDISSEHERIIPLNVNADSIYTKAWSLDNQYIAIQSKDRRFIDIFRAETGSKIQTLELSEETSASRIQWSPDNQFLAIDDGTPVNVFDLSHSGYSCD